MSKYFRGFWSFAPMSECITHAVEASNEDEAIEKLIKWALAHRNYVDEPMDFEVEELADKRLKSAMEIVKFDIRFSEYDGSIWKVYEQLADPCKVEEMIAYYKHELSRQKEIADDFQSSPVWERAVAGNAVKQINSILSALNA